MINIIQLDSKTNQDSLQPKPTQSDELWNLAEGKRLNQIFFSQKGQLIILSTHDGAVWGIKPVKAGKTGIIPISVIRWIICLASWNCAWCQPGGKGPACFWRLPIRNLFFIVHKSTT